MCVWGGRSNHVSFYYNQIAALQMYTGDTKSALASLKSYFSNQFQDQIAASGEQPFEATRTRPYHYRCFNLEAMIVSPPSPLPLTPLTHSPTHPFTHPTRRQTRSSATNSAKTSGRPSPSTARRSRARSTT